METKVKIQIKSVFGKVLFEYEKEDNTIKDTLVEAVKRGADLGGADLRDADLGGAVEVPRQKPGQGQVIRRRVSAGAALN